MRCRRFFQASRERERSARWTSAISGGRRTHCTASWGRCWVYTHTTAAVLRAKDSVMETVTTVRENAEDIYADAKAINQQRAQQEADAVMEDASEAE